jgi:hypothetical protein
MPEERRMRRGDTAYYMCGLTAKEYECARKRKASARRHRPHLVIDDPDGIVEIDNTVKKEKEVKKPLVWQYGFEVGCGVTAKTPVKKTPAKPDKTRTKTIEEVVLEDLVEALKAEVRDKEKENKKLEKKVKKLEKVIDDIKEEKEGKIKFIKDNPDFLEIS